MDAARARILPGADRHEVLRRDAAFVVQGARDGGAAVGGLKVGDEGKARVARHAEDRLEERRQDDLSGTQSAVEGEHLNEAHGEHDTGEQIEGRRGSPRGR